MIKHLTFKILLITVLVLGNTSAYAAMDKNGYVGALAGASRADIGESNSSRTTNTTFGLEAGAKLIPALGIGFYGTYFGQNNATSVFGLKAGTRTQSYYLAGEVNFFASIFHIGADLGASINTWSANIGDMSTSSSKTSLIYGPEAGFDVPLGQSTVSLGGEAHYFLTRAIEGNNNLQVLAALKVWL